MVKKLLVLSLVFLCSPLLVGCANKKTETQIKEIREMNRELMDAKWSLEQQLAQKNQEIEDLNIRLAEAENQSSSERTNWQKTLSRYEREKQDLEDQLGDARRELGKVKSDTTNIEGVTTHQTPDGVALRLDDVVFFKPGKAVLSEKGKSSLLKVAQLLNGNDYINRRIRIEGHCDSDPIRYSKNKYKSNWELSSSRSMAVLHFLENNAVEGQRLHSAAFSFHHPVVANDTKTNKSKNRRVEIVVLNRTLK